MTTSEIIRQVRRIAGCIWDDATDATSPLGERIRQAAAWQNLGTDGDLGAADRESLRRLADEADRLG
jgi:hypothetical protein